MTITHAAVARETARRMRRFDLQVGEDVRRLRLEAGVSLTDLGRVVGIHRSHIARIEAGTARPSLEVLTAIGVALGADLSLRYFPGSGPRIHDRFQAPMVEALLRSLDRRWSPELEVPVTQPSRGVIDVVLTDRDGTVVAAEVQSEMRRLEQQLRWSAEKADGLSLRLATGERGVSSIQVSRLLVLRSTVATRAIAQQYEAMLTAAFPTRTRDLVQALTTPTTPWPGSGIIWMRLDGAQARVLPFPPPRVALGR